MLRIIFSYLSGRTLLVNYLGVSSSPKALPGGAPAGCYLGGLIFVIKFNGALMRPKIPRLNSLTSKANNNFGHWKYFDDATVATTVNLRRDLEKRKSKKVECPKDSDVYFVKRSI